MIRYYSYQTLQLIELNNKIMSAFAQRMELKQDQQKLQFLQNRINHLQRQQEKQIKNIQKSQKDRDMLIEKKLSAFHIKNQYSSLHNDTYEHELNLKRKSLEQRVNHKRTIKVINQAIKDVKKQQAQKIRVTSLQHLKKIKMMKEDILIGNKEKRKFNSLSCSNIKVQHLKSMRIRLQDKLLQKKLDIQRIKQKKLAQKQMIYSLQQKEQLLMKNIQDIHKRSLQQKRKYFQTLTVKNEVIAELQKSDKGSTIIESKYDQMIVPKESEWSITMPKVSYSPQRVKAIIEKTISKVDNS